MSVSSPVTTRRGPIRVTTSRTAPVAWLDDEVILLSAGQTLTLPEAGGRITVKALGSGCFIRSPAGVDTGEVSAGAVVTSTDPVPLLAVGESALYVASSGPWYRIY